MLSVLEPFDVWILHEILSFSLPEQYEEFNREIIEKATRILGVRRLALFTRNGENVKCQILFGFKDSEEALKEAEKGGEYGFIYRFNDNSGFLYMESPYPLSPREKRLLTIFARRIEEFLKYKRLEEERREFEKKAILLNSIPDSVVVISPNNIIQDANDTWFEVTGFSPSEIIGKSLHSISCFDGESQNALKEISGKWLSTPKRLVVRANIKGARRYFEINPAPAGKSGEIILVFRDITELKKTEDKFKKTVELLQILVDAMPEIVYLKDANGRIIVVNRACADFLGKSEEEILEKTVDEVLPPNLAAQCKLSDELVILKKKPIRIEERFKWKGRMVVFETIKAPVYDVNGNFIGIIGIARDITEREQAEKSKRFRMFMDYSNDAIFLVEAENGKIIDVNKTACDWLGYSKDELLEMRISDIADLDIDLGSTANPEKGMTVEGWLHRKNGTKFPISVSLRAVDIDEKMYIVAIARDITELKDAEERIKKMNKHLSLLNKILRHDLRNNLTIMKSYLDLFKEMPEEDFLTKIDERIEICSEFITTIKDIEEALMSGKGLTDINISEVLEKEVGKLKHDNLVVTANIHGKIYVRADDMISSVLENILLNAIFHNDKELKKIHVDVKEVETDWVEIRIADNGPGIPDEMKEEIFKEGVKGEKTGRTGLGLFIVKMLIEKYGGKIWVEDNEPEGSVFVIRMRRGGTYGKEIQAQ